MEGGGEKKDGEKDKTPSTPRLTGSLAAPGTHDDAITRLVYFVFVCLF